MTAPTTCTHVQQNPCRQGASRYDGALVGPMLNARHNLPPGGTVGGQFVGGNAFEDYALLLHQLGQQALGCLGVPATLDDLIQYIAILIDGAPQPVLPTSDADGHL